MHSQGMTAMRNQRQGRRTHLLKWTIVLGGLLLLPLHAHDTSAQVLNQQINALLANNCAGLGTGGGLNQTPNLTGLVGELRLLCTPLPNKGGGQSQDAATAGGGAASVQGSAASILNRTLLGRLEDLKNEERAGTEQSSSMRFNLLGMISMAGMRNLNVSSPFYAATTASGGLIR